MESLVDRELVDVVTSADREARNLVFQCHDQRSADGLADEPLHCPCANI